MKVTAPAAFRPAGHPCDQMCRDATGPASTCTCACGGTRHGSDRAAQQAALTARLTRIVADPFTRIGAPLDDDAF